MKIGIPRGLGIYEYPILFKNFFENLGFEVVLSGKTDLQILQNGLDNSLSESCLASKIFIGHVADLVKKSENDKIDYIFIPRLCNFENSQTTCVKLFAIYDICNNIFNSKFITLNIDYEHNAEFKAFLKLGKELNMSSPKIVKAYINARKSQREYNRNVYLKQIKEISNSIHDTKVLIVAHPYVLYDELLGMKIVRYLKKENIKVFFANINSLSMENPKFFRWKKEKSRDYLNISDTIFWKSSKNLLNGLSTNINNVDGIIYISVFPCGTDSLVNELAIRKVNDIPSINLVLDEQDSDVGIYTRMESFLDILRMNKASNGKMEEGKIHGR